MNYYKIPGKNIVLDLDAIHLVELSDGFKSIFGLTDEKEYLVLVLNGFQQEIDFDSKDEALEVYNIIVDYLQKCNMSQYGKSSFKLK